MKQEKYLYITVETTLRRVYRVPDERKPWQPLPDVDDMQEVGAGLAHHGYKPAATLETRHEVVDVSDELPTAEGIALVEAYR